MEEVNYSHSFKMGWVYIGGEAERDFEASGWYGQRPGHESMHGMFWVY